MTIDNIIKGNPVKPVKSVKWPPAEYALPDSIEEIEAGRPGKQRSLFDNARDQSKAGRLARLLEIEGVRTADTMIERHTNPPGDGGQYSHQRGGS